MANLSYKNDQDSDQRLNPAELHEREQQGAFDRDFESMTGSSNYQKNADEAQENKNIEKISDSEETNGGSGWKTAVGKDGNKKEKTEWKAVVRKKGPMGAIIALLLGGGAGLSFLFAPGMVAIHLTEVLTEDLNDQVAAADIRTTHIFRSKIKNMTGAMGVCSTKVNIRCKFSSMNKYQINNFKKAGFEMECRNGPCDRMIGNRLTAITLPDGTRITNPQQLTGLARTNPDVAAGLRRAFNPTYRMMSDTVANNRFAKFGGKINQFAGKKRADMHKALLSASEKRATDIGKVEKKTETVDGEEKTTFVDSDGNTVEGMDQAAADRHNSMVDRLNNSGGLGKKATGALRGISALGAVDLWCTGYGLYRSVSTGAKVIRSEALGRLATAHHSAVQAAKAGDESVTPEMMDFIGTTLTETDTRKEIVDPSDDEAKKMMPNPNYGKSAMDSAFLKTSMHGDVPDIKAESTQYMVAGGGVGEFADFAKQFSKEKPSYCKIVQNNITRGAAAVVGLFLGFSSGGATLALSATASVAAGFAVSYLEAMLTDMIAGNIVTEDTKSTQYGDGLFAGSAVLLGSIAKGRGLRPLTEENINAYMQTSNEVAARNTEIETTIAKATPFDINNKYSFIGSFARSISPSVTRSSNTLASLPQSMSSLLQLASSTISGSNSVSAKDGNAKRFDICDDQDYKKLKIKADVACNVRYGLTDKELALEPEAVLDYMLGGDHINEEGEPSSDDYKKYLESCVSPEYGVFSSDGDEGKSTFGDYEQCVEDGEGDKYNYFRVYTLDNSIASAMDSEPEGTESQPNTESSGAGMQISIASFNVRGSNHDGKNGTLPYKQRMPRTVQTIKDEGFDVIGFQEFVSDQRTEFKKQLSTYELSTSDGGSDNGNGIGWNAEKYEKVGGGTMPGLLYTTGNKLKAPWVRLKDKATGQEFVFANTHDPANVHDKPVTKNAARRTNNAQKHVEFMKKKSAGNTPVFMTGDFNSSFTGNGDDPDLNNSNRAELQPYCIMTGDGSIQNAFDMFKNREVKCPNSGINWDKEDPGKGCSTQIDHLFVAAAGMPTSISDFGCVKKGEKTETLAGGNGSDHDTVKFVVSIEGNEASTGGSVGSDDFGTACASGYALGAPCDGQCVSFVKYRLLKYNTKYTGGRLGHGKDVVKTLAGLGYETGTIARPGSVFSTSSTSRPSVGHTGIVSEVKEDGSIVIEEYNYDYEKAYGTRTMTKAAYTESGYTFAYIGGGFNE